MLLDIFANALFPNLFFFPFFFRKILSEGSNYGSRCFESWYHCAAIVQVSTCVEQHNLGVFS